MTEDIGDLRAGSARPLLPREEGDEPQGLGGGAVVLQGEAPFVVLGPLCGLCTWVYRFLFVHDNVELVQFEILHEPHYP